MIWKKLTEIIFVKAVGLNDFFNTDRRVINPYPGKYA
jgi:hypothetical protein